MSDENKDKLKVVFAPGCFDQFEGTQEELDSMMADIKDMFESGNFNLEDVELVTDEDLLEELQHIENTPRNLQ